MESKLSIERAKIALFSGDAILTFSNPDLKRLTHRDTVEAGIGRDCQKIVNQVISFSKNKSKLNSIK